MKKVATILMTAALVSFSPKTEKRIYLSLSTQKVELILKGLSKLPYEEAAPLIQEIQIEGNKQLALTDTTHKK